MSELKIHENMTVAIYDNCLGCSAEAKGLYDLTEENIVSELKSLKMGVMDRELSAFYVRQHIYKKKIRNVIFPICKECHELFLLKKHPAQWYFKNAGRKHIFIFTKPEEFKGLLVGGNGWNGK